LRISPSFTVAEHAEVSAAARRAGLTPTGFCAVARRPQREREAAAGDVPKIAPRLGRKRTKPPA